MGYKYSEDEFLAEAVQIALSEGLSRVTFGRLARRLGVADRLVVYYFPTKEVLITRTALALGARLQGLLDEAFGDEPLPSAELIRRAWPVLTSTDADPVFAVFFEIVGLGAAGIAPFSTLAPAVLDTWITWLAGRVDAPADSARSVALLTIATLDGLLLLRHVSGATDQELATLAGAPDTTGRPGPE